MLADLWAILDPLPHLPWMLLLYDDMAIQTTALVPSTSPNHLSAPTLCCPFCRISFLLSCVSQYQPIIANSLRNFAWMGQQLPLWST